MNKLYSEKAQQKEGTKCLVTVVHHGMTVLCNTFHVFFKKQNKILPNKFTFICETFLKN